MDATEPGTATLDNAAASPRRVAVVTGGNRGIGLDGPTGQFFYERQPLEW